ncbi:hypothetical protein [Telmatospirillum sp.]|uniref:hypothetical protein n=1 Tax=Telmatospirillum sp. TaxID=2079197 RepID=UPI00284F5D9C|nr:hypothetical protein [Telmatospirillum sp.]MDR3440723.1 hypothetical protein [Telmatospirillum sp.]
MQLRRRSLHLLALAALCFLAACQAPQSTASLGRPGGPLPGDGTPGLDGTAPKPGEPGDDPGHLKGLAAGEVVAKLGDPGYRRRETPAEVWQYFGPGCVLDVFLYDDKGAQRVTHAELRSRNLTPSGQASCLAQLLQGKRGETNS